MDHSLCQNNIVILSLKIDFVLANGADPAEMPHYAAFHLGLRCLPKYSFRGYLQSTKALVDNVSLKQVNISQVIRLSAIS